MGRRRRVTIINFWGGHEDSMRKGGRSVTMGTEVCARLLLLLPRTVAGIANQSKSSFPMRLGCRELQTATATSG